MAYLLALLSAAAYGTADFLGGLASRGASTAAVVFVSQAAGLVVLAGLLPVLPAAAPTARDLWWGLAAGIAGSVGVALLYRALAIGTMALVAPTTAVCAVIIPVAAGVILGERPTARVTLGIVIALAAIVLVSQAPSSSPHAMLPDPHVEPSGVPRGLGMALLSGIAIGFFFLCLAQTDMAAGLWPLAVARSAALVLFAPVALRPAARRMGARALGTAVAGGILDMLANAFYLIAVREGPLAAVVTLSSLYPASTILLARVVLHERLRRLQMAGIAAALAAVLLIAG